MEIGVWASEVEFGNWHEVVWVEAGIREVPVHKHSSFQVRIQQPENVQVFYVRAPINKPLLLVVCILVFTMGLHFDPTADDSV